MEIPKCCVCNTTLNYDDEKPKCPNNECKDNHNWNPWACGCLDCIDCPIIYSRKECPIHNDERQMSEDPQFQADSSVQRYIDKDTENEIT